MSDSEHTMNNKDMIGVVGGAGPLAGIDLLKKIIEETEARTDQDHAPVTVLSVPEKTPDRTAYLLGQEKNNPAYPISQLFLYLERIGATIAAIPCNTAHAEPIFDVLIAELRKAGSRLKLLSLIEETVEFIKTEVRPGATVGVIATIGTQKAGVYRNTLQEAGFVALEPNDHWQHRIHHVIYNEDYGIKAHSSPVTEKATNELKQAMNMLANEGADALVLGCGEISSVISQRFHNDIPIIDPTRILARALVREWDSTKLKTILHEV